MKIKSKLVVSFLVAALVPFTIGIAYVNIKVIGTAMDAGKIQAAIYARNISTRMESYFGKWGNITDTFSTFPSVQAKNWEVLHPIFQSTDLNNEDIGALVLVNKDGTYWYAGVPGNPAYNYMVSADDYDPNAALKSVADLPYYQELIQNNTKNERREIVTPLYVAPEDGKKMFAIASPIIIPGQGVDGIVAVTVPTNILADQYSTVLYDFEEKFGRGAALNIIDTNNMVVSRYAWDDEAGAFTDTVGYSQEMVDTTGLSQDSYEVIERMKAEGLTQVSYSKNGEKIFVSYSDVQGSPFSVYLSVPEAKLFEVSQNMVVLTVGVGVFMGVIIIIATFFIGSRLGAAIAKTANALHEISYGEGDLSVRMETKDTDELGDVGRYFNGFIEKQGEMISRIKSESTRLEDVSMDLEKNVESIRNDIRNIASGTANLNEKSVEQTAATEETAATLDRISKTLTVLATRINEESDAVGNSSASVEQMVRNVDSISENLGRAVKRFDDLKSASTDGKNNIRAVQELVTNVSMQSENLLDTNKLINAIANQTNLLAMNAAIEAAHAGDAGRGFSVVAEEIRKLAEDSSKQSKTIATELKSIVSNISTIVEATAKADVSFDNVVNQVGEAGGIVETINSSLREQTVGNQSVLTSLENIQNITEEVRDGSVEMSTGITTIVNAVSKLMTVSKEVQQNAKNIYGAVKTINESAERINENSSKNRDTISTLNDLTSKFKI